MAARILVVDDNPSFLRATEALLAIRGLDLFDVASGGDEALASLDRGCPDGVLLDVNLVGQDGFHVAAALAARCPSMPIVLMSSDVDAARRSELHRAGAVALVSKTELATTDLGVLFGLPG
jgi:CheY-like chemotaxis protein